MSKETKPTSELKRRLASLEITDARNTITVRHPYNSMPFKFKYFTEEKGTDNILINYPTYDGHPLLLADYKTQYSRTRYTVIPPGRKKYEQMAGTEAEPFFTPKIIEAYAANAVINTLFITEGEFKAFAMDNVGLFAVGIGGNFSFIEKGENTLHNSILRVIERCKVQNLVLRLDADSLKVEWEEGKDLYMRLNQFCKSVQRFNELCKPLEIDCYFAHIDKMHINNAKGIDDLLYHKECDKAERNKIIKELNNLTAGTNRKYIQCLHLTGNSTYNIQKYFGIFDVENFYEKYESIVEGHDFVFKRETWFVDDSGKLKISSYDYAKSYIRVGCAFFKRIYIQNAHKKTEQSLAEWQIGEINRDFNNSKFFIQQINKYDAFCNIPDHGPTYRRVIEIKQDGVASKLYNRYNPIQHNIQPGEWPTIEMFLRHIFNYENIAGENLYNFGLDYIQILYQKPTQRLPVLCFVSSDRNTGKTTFLEFLRLIFKENATILDNERFTGKFTSHFTDKLLIGVDEGFIPVEQKIMKERIKNMSTAKRQWLEAKGKNAQEIDYFGKLILCSNDEKNFMQIDDGENRFAVIKVKSFQKDDPDILQKMEAEIGQFLYFLITRKLHYPVNISRFSFPINTYMTPAMQAVVERTKPRYEAELTELLTEHFYNFNKESLSYTMTDILNMLKTERNYNFANGSLLKSIILDNKLGILHKKADRYKTYSIQQNDFNEDDKITIIPEKKIGRYYIFHYKKFIPEADWPDFEKNLEFTGSPQPDEPTESYKQSRLELNAQIKPPF